VLLCKEGVPGGRLRGIVVSAFLFSTGSHVFTHGAEQPTITTTGAEVIPEEIRLFPIINIDVSSATRTTTSTSATY